jgi:hypothetical protein
MRKLAALLAIALPLLAASCAEIVGFPDVPSLEGDGGNGDTNDSPVGDDTTTEGDATTDGNQGADSDARPGAPRDDGAPPDESALQGDAALSETGGPPPSNDGSEGRTSGVDGGPATDGSSGLPNCVTWDVSPCGSFTTATGTSIPLGPYGAQMDVNVGQGFENAIAAGDMADAGTCPTLVATYDEDARLSAAIDNTRTLDFALYTVYRPANWVAGETYPVLTWGNGTCFQPETYGALLRYVASYGFFVIAANSRFLSTGTEMLNALNFAAAANANAASPYYQKLDLTKIGAWGHSQGSSAATKAASDSRIEDLIMFNAQDSATKPFLAVSGDMDITGFTPAGMATAVNAATVSGAWLYYHMIPDAGSLGGHLTLVLQPERVVGPATAWWQMWFKTGSTATAARAWFVGSSCNLCNMTSEFEYGEHGL